MLPMLESLIPGYAAAMLEALEAGDYDVTCDGCSTCSKPWGARHE